MLDLEISHAGNIRHSGFDASGRGIDKSKITLPALFFYSKDDQTVRPSVTDEVVKNWGGPVEVMIVETPQEASNHVITGDILNPTTTKMVSERIIKWIEKIR